MFLFFQLVKSCLIWEVFINPQYSANITLSYCFDVYRIILMKKKSILWEDIEGVSNNFLLEKITFPEERNYEFPEKQQKIVEQNGK